MGPPSLSNFFEPEILQAAGLKGLRGVRHGFFTRRGTPGAHAANAGRLSINGAAALDGLGLEAGSLLSVDQVHGNTVIGVGAPWPDNDRPRADGMVTRLPRMALGIWCADCAPVLLADADAGVIGACHAGWRGALAGIVDAIVRAMVREGARPNRIAAAIGPCIGFASYEVSEDFAEPFLRQNPENIRFFAAAAKAPKLRFDLPGYLGQALKAAGIGQVEILGFDTLADPERFFSFRRATLTGEPSAGRQLSAIALAAPWG